MFTHASCDRSCSLQSGGTCPGQACPETPSSVQLDEVIERFEAEATFGVCPTPRYRLPYYSWGQGPPLLFVHGVSDVSRSFILVVRQLAAHFRCIAYDLPSGHGDGARLGRYRHEDLVSDVWALLDHLGIERSYILGSSFGSTIALRALKQRPDRLVRGILQGGLAYRPLRRAERFVTWLFRRLPGPTARLPKRERLMELTHKKAFDGKPETFWRAYVDWTGKARLAAMGHQARWLHGVDLRADLPQIRQPILLIHGDRDAVIPRPHADLLLAGLPAAGMVVIEGAGHVPYYTHPEALARVIHHFLTPRPEGSTTCPSQEVGRTTPPG